MSFANVNFLAVLVSAVAYMVIGFLWYGPLFAKPWMALVGFTEEQLRQGADPKMYALTFVGSLVASLVLAVFINATGMTTLAGGVQVGLLAGVGFVAPSFGANYIFLRKPLKLYLIDALYQMFTLLVAGAILGAWR